MSNSLNKVILIGNVGQEPIIKYNDSHKGFAVLNIATNEKWKDKQNGQERDKTE